MRVYKATWSTPIGTDWCCDSFEDAMKMAELIAKNILCSYSCKISDYSEDDFVIYKFYLEDDENNEEENEYIRSMTEDERTEYLEIHGYELNLYPLPWDFKNERCGPNKHLINTTRRDGTDEELEAIFAENHRQWKEEQKNNK